MLVDLYSQQTQPKPKNNYFTRRKAEKEEFKKRLHDAQLKRAEKMYIANEIHMYRHGKPLFDSDLKRLRVLLGNKGCDELLERIENAVPTDFDTIKYL